ncbi:unnamed protein product, partial [Ceratitis capitata]
TTGAVILSAECQAEFLSGFMTFALEWKGASSTFSGAPWVKKTALPHTWRVSHTESSEAEANKHYNSQQFEARDDGSQSFIHARFATRMSHPLMKYDMSCYQQKNSAPTFKSCFHPTVKKCSTSFLK